MVTITPNTERAFDFLTEMWDVYQNALGSRFTKMSMDEFLICYAEQLNRKQVEDIQSMINLWEVVDLAERSLREGKR